VVKLEEENRRLKLYIYMLIICIVTIYIRAKTCGSEMAIYNGWAIYVIGSTSIPCNVIVQAMNVISFHCMC